MPVAFTCPNPACARTSRLPDEAAGRKVKCPACGQPFTAPSATLAPKTTDDGTTRRATAVSSVTAETVGRFEVRGKLGEGAFGAVYRAYDPQLDREVALKVPHAAVLDSPKRVERFLREAKAAANLRHPHIVPVFDAGSDGGRHYIASAFIAGQKLADAVEASDGGLDVDRAARLVRELAEALAYAHEQGIVHRDVKPDNVMLDQHDRVHLMDFGLAVRQDAESRLTNDGAVMGTPSYMSPEQAKGETDKVGPAADQYACGVVLYELLTGKTPFSGPIPVVLHNQIHTEPTPPKLLRRAVPKDLEQVCLMALNKRPEERYASCRELADDLRRWQAGEPVSVRPLNPVEKATRWVRMHRVVAGLLAMVVIAVAVGLATSTTFAVSADSHRRLAEQRETEAQSNAELARQAEQAIRASTTSLLLDRALGRFETQDNLAGYLNLAAALERSEEAADTDRLIRRELAAWAAYTPKLESALGRADDGQMNHWRFGARGDGRQAAVGGENRIELVPLTADGPPERNLECEGRVFSVSYSPDDRYLLAVMSVASTATDPGRLIVWDLMEPTAPPVTLEHPRAVSRATFMPDGRVATCAYDGVVRVWELGQPATPRHELTINGLVAELRPDADGKRMYIWERAGRLLLWEPGQPEQGVIDLKRHVGVGAVTPDGLTLACDAGFGIWLKTPSGEHTLPVVSGGVRSLALAEGGRTLFAATDDGVQVWDTKTRGRVCHLNPGLADVKGVFAIRDDRVATVSRTIRHAGTTTLRVWKVRPEWTGRQVCATTAGIWSVSAGTSTETVAWGSNDGRCELWDLGTSSRIGSGWSHAGSATAVLLSSDERSLLTGSLDGKLRLWDTKEDQRLVWEADSGGNPTSHPSKSVWAIALGRDGKTAYFGGADFAIHSVSVATGQPTRPPIPIGSQINAIAVGPNDAHLFVGCETPPPRRVQLDGEVEVKPLADISVAKSAAVTADGVRCLFTTWGGHALVFDAATFRPLGLPMRHRSAIWRGVLSPDESLTATASTDATVRLWDTSSGRPIGPPIPHPAEVTSVAFTTGGRGLVSSTQTGKVLQFDLPPAVTHPGANARRLAEIHTGAELLPDGGVRLLTADEWQQRRGSGD